MAKPHLDTLAATNSIYGAEAKFLLAEQHAQQGDYDASDTLIYQLINQVPSYPYWIAKGFILLADNFVAKDDLYNAKLTLKSVIENADDKKLIAIAKEKLEIVKASEKVEEQKADPIEINMYKLKEEKNKKNKVEQSQEKEKTNE